MTNGGCAAPETRHRYVEFKYKNCSLCTCYIYGNTVKRKEMCMEQKSGITITVRDRLLRAWEDAMAQVKAFELWSSEVEDDEVSRRYSPNTAEDDGLHARACWSFCGKRKIEKAERTGENPVRFFVLRVCLPYYRCRSMEGKPGFTLLRASSGRGVERVRQIHVSLAASRAWVSARILCRIVLGSVHTRVGRNRWPRAFYCCRSVQRIMLARSTDAILADGCCALVSAGLFLKKHRML